MTPVRSEDVEVRARLTKGFNRARLELEMRRARRPLIYVLAAAGLALGCGVWVAGKLSGGALKATRTIRVAVNDATGVVATRDDVRFKGFAAGTVTKVEMVHGHPVLTATVQKRFGPIYRDARMVLRPTTPLEDMYLDVLDRGHPAAGELKSSDPLDADRTQTGVNVSDVLQVFDPRTRAHMAALIDQLGRGTADRGEALQAAFVKLVPFLRATGRLTDAVARRAARTQRLSHDVALLTSELGRRQHQLRNLASMGAQTLETTAHHERSLAATIDDLAPAVGDVRTTLQATRAILPQVDGALTALARPVRMLPSSLHEISTLSVRARPAVTRLQRPVRDLVPLSSALRPLASHLQDATTSLRPQVGEVNDVTKALGSCTMTLQRFFQWTSSAFALGDNHSVAARGDAAVSLDTIPGVRDPRVRYVKGCAGGTALENGPAKRDTFTEGGG